LFSIVLQLVELMGGSGSFQPMLHGYAASAGFAQRQLQNVDFVSFFLAHPTEKQREPKIKKRNGVRNALRKTKEIGR
jgi:phosphoenolpyruvate carboxylase